ncbi:glycine cleavage system protein GcvH [Candidatus Bathyarchaeota archaeon]|nr:glycine cleavage system protein GcvH [Candidatus Bathyarchaeota archaeon]
MAEIKDNLLYTKTHQWYDPESGKVGITDHAQDQLGEIVYVELLWDDGLAGTEVSAVTYDGDEPASDPIDDISVESQKAVGDIYAPLSGEITSVNEDLMDEPEKVNEDPYGEGWLFTLDPSDFDGEKGNLLDAAAYKAFCE